MSRNSGPATVDAVDALLPQTQCRQCGYAGCRPYAQAIADGRAAINQCPPGGDDAVRAIAELLNLPAVPLDRRFGATKPPAVAVIDEQACIGCTLCIQACPVDAIVGAPKLLHTVIALHCTGCELCIAPCPVDCIRLLESAYRLTPEQKKSAAALARSRFESRNLRLQRERVNRPARPASGREAPADGKKKATIERAIARARLRLRESVREPPGRR